VSLRRLALLAAVAAVAGIAPGAGTAATRCSASGLSAQLPKQALPAKVAALRARLAAAAVRCGYAALARIAAENPRGFTFSYGAARDAAAYWRRLESTRADRPLARLVAILRLPVTRNEIGSYAWPSAYTEHPTAADWTRLVTAGVYTRARVNAMRRDGTYLGYRTAISPAGRWLFFVAGD
jgi:hypothetical protein